MTGEHRVIIRNSRNKYDFTVKRNITVLCGNSGTGKTTLYDMVRERNRYKEGSNIHLTCDKDVIALSGDEWQDRLEKIKDSIIIIDEDNDFILTHEFARAVRDSDNYYVLVTRDYIPSLPYSVDEIYELRGNKNKTFQPVYRNIEKMYDRPTRSRLPFRPDFIITEDSKAGFQFFKNVAKPAGIECVSAEGKAKIYDTLKNYRGKNVVVIADGAAFGAEIGNIVKQQKLAPRKIAIFLPESFEWLILSSGVVEVERDRVLRAGDYVDSRRYMSWEQYFTDLLRETTRNVPYMQYRKDKLAEYYTHGGTAEKIKEVASGIDFGGYGG